MIFFIQKQMTDIIKRLENCIAYLDNNYKYLVATLRSLNVKILYPISLDESNDLDLPCEMNDYQLKIFKLSSALHDLQQRYSILYECYIQEIYKPCNYYFDKPEKINKEFYIL